VIGLVILFDRFNLPEDILEIIFATQQQIIVAKVFIKWLKDHDRTVTKTEMSFFANTLHEGKYETEIEDPRYRGKLVKLSYNKRQFYDRILTPMKSMGLIYYDLYKKNYSLSDQFNKDMLKIGLMWKKDLDKS